MQVILAGLEIRIPESMCDRLLTDAVKFCMPYEDEMVRIAGIAQGSENEVFKKRAQSILNLLDYLFRGTPGK